LIEIKANRVTVSINDNGCIADIKYFDGTSLFHGTFVPFLRTGSGGRMFYPERATFNGKELAFDIQDGSRVCLEVVEKEDYAKLTVREISDSCDTLIFGPYPTSLGGTVGNVIGVVREKGYAMGVQALNIKTIGGFPLEFKDEAYKEYGSDRYSPEISVHPLDYFNSAAYRTEFGSVLQLYCNNRCRMRMRTVMEHNNVPVPPMEGPDAEIKGASFAIFGCDEKKILSIIEKIEIDEGLPHPMINGQWAKVSRESMRSYLIAEFDENNFDRMLDYIEKAGFRELYHPEPFSNWGHFDLRKDHFPDGDESLVRMAEKAAKRGIGLGLHTLTNFTTTNDPYVTPVPHKELAVRGEALLLFDVGTEEDRIIVSEKEIFEEASHLSTIWIDDELIQYESASEEDGRITLNHCIRGAFGTVPACHKAGAAVKKLWDHGYKVFFPNIRLQDRYSDRLAELFNKAGLVQISFDGLEGCRYTGEDEYGVNRFCMRCWDGWDHNVINDASQLNHFLWHMHTRMNWGEPWGAKMREGQTSHRVKNQEFFKDNLFPRMLGWFLVRPADRRFEATTLSDVEWMLSKAAGFDAGFALVSGNNALDRLGITDEILNAVRMWEYLRLKNAIPDELKEKLLCLDTEWHLEYAGNGLYRLYPKDISQTYTCDLQEMQPGQPGGADWVFDNKLGAGSFQCSIRVTGDGYIENPTLKTSGGMLRFKCRINCNQYLFFKKDGSAVITDRNYNTIGKAEVIGNAPIAPGTQQLSFYCDFDGDEAPEVRLTMITSGKPYEIIACQKK